MFRLNNIPIQRKLRYIILATCTVALCVASGALFALQFYFFQREFRRDLVAVADVISDISSAAVSFNRPDGARDILQVLKSKPQIISALIVLKNGRIFAAFGDLKRASTIRGTPESGFFEHGGTLTYIEPIMEDGDQIATLYIHTDYRTEALKLQGLYATILIVILATSFLVAVLVSSKLEGVISDPIKALADTAHKIATRNDYSLRARKVGDDEIGAFADTFNGMLDQIQNRDQALLHEIAERARAEQEIQRIHGQLMDASRQAGMAEVATGVLHNVGNVLNSVNVSATIIAEKLAQSRAGNLVRATQLLQEQNGSLARYLTEDPKGRLLPGYLVEVSSHVAREREDALAELDLLTRNIEHIKDIVATQQTYARISGLVESMPAEALVEDALRMNAGSFERHGISVIRNFDEVPLAAVDKHKVLQILVNLMRNAKYAIDDGTLPQKSLTLGIRLKDEAIIEITLADTGCGISEHNLTRIFSHGFTTRKEGHGFGLHSAALAAQQMGGRLYAQSPGPNRGATFTLELPVAASPAAAPDTIIT